MCLRRIQKRVSGSILRHRVYFVVPGMARFADFVGLNFEEEDFGVGQVVLDADEFHQDAAYQAVCIRVLGISSSVEKLETHRIVHKDSDLCGFCFWTSLVVPERLDVQQKRL